MTSLQSPEAPAAGSACGRMLFAVTMAMAAFVSILAFPARLDAETARDAILTQGTKLYSQGNEELIIRHFFNDRRDGFFLDVGAWEWRNASTTYYLEHHLGWSGIAVDAQRKYAFGYEKHRPNTRFFAYLVTDHSGDVGTLYAAGPFSSTDAEHLDVFKEHPDRYPGAERLTAEPVKVTTITLDDLLEQNGVEKINFMSMDIEGSEPPALAGFDIERYRPELVCIEVTAKTRKAIVDYFDTHGYVRIDEYMKYDMVNWYYTTKPQTNTR